MKKASVLLKAVGLLVCLAPTLTGAQEEAPLAPALNPTGETYRLRVENVAYGRVEASWDNGAHYVLLGRVERPASVFALDKAATTAGVVLRSGPDGLAFAIGKAQVLKLRAQTNAVINPKVGTSRKRRFVPATPPRYEPEAIATNLPANQGVWKSLTPPPGSVVQVQTSDTAPHDFYTGYTPSERDTFQFTVKLPVPPAAKETIETEPQRADAWKASVRQQLEGQSTLYRGASLARAQSQRTAVVSGMLTLRARLSSDERETASVFYVIDGDILAVQNAAPFQFEWDTRRVDEGEHVIEIRACNSANAVLTRIRRLVVVHNG